VISTWGGGKFHNFFGEKKKKKKKTIKTFVLWDAPQLIKLINMNHNKYLSSCKSCNKYNIFISNIQK